MSIVCRRFDLLFTHIPKTGGIFVERFLLDHADGTKVGSRHATYRTLHSKEEFGVRAFVVREPIEWYRSYWAYARSVTRHRAAWPIWDTGTSDHPTTQLDQTCGSPSFEGFVRNVLREFPNGFVRSMYCDFLNGSTHTLRTERLADDLQVLLGIVGHPNPALVASMPRENESPPKWKDQTALSPDLEVEITTVDTLDGLVFPFVS